MTQRCSTNDISGAQPIDEIPRPSKTQGRATQFEGLGRICGTSKSTGVPLVGRFGHPVPMRFDSDGAKMNHLSHSPRQHSGTGCPKRPTSGTAFRGDQVGAVLHDLCTVGMTDLRCRCLPDGASF